jgi:hypothetical protein
MAEKELITVQARQEDILRRAAILTKNGQIVVTNQEEADFAGELVTEGALLQKEHEEQPEYYGTRAEPGEIPILDKLKKRRIAAFDKLDVPLGFIVTSAKNAISSWIKREREKREQAALKDEARKRKKDPAFVAPREEPSVANVTPTVRWEAEVFCCKGKLCGCANSLSPIAADDLHYTQGLQLLVRAAALAYLRPNQGLLDVLAREKHDMVDKDGFLPGAPGVRPKKIEGLRRG